MHRLKQKQNDTTRIPPIVIRLNNVQQRNLKKQRDSEV